MIFVRYASISTFLSADVSRLGLTSSKGTFHPVIDRHSDSEKNRSWCWEKPTIQQRELITVVHGLIGWLIRTKIGFGHFLSRRIDSTCNYSTRVDWLIDWESNWTLIILDFKSSLSTSRLHKLINLKSWSVVESMPSMSLFWDCGKSFLIGHDDPSDSSWCIRSLYMRICSIGCTLEAEFSAWNITSPFFMYDSRDMAVLFMIFS